MREGEGEGGRYICQAEREKRGKDGKGGSKYLKAS